MKYIRIHRYTIDGNISGNIHDWDIIEVYDEIPKYLNPYMTDVLRNHDYVRYSESPIISIVNIQKNTKSVFFLADLKVKLRHWKLEIVLGI